MARPPANSSSDANGRGVTQRSPCDGGDGFCFRDTTRAFANGWEAAVGTWVVFAGSGDSLAFSGWPDTAAADSTVAFAVGGAIVTLFTEDASGGTFTRPAPSPVSIRIPVAGSWSLTVGLSGDVDNRGTPYVLRIVPVKLGHTALAARLKPTGQRARLTTVGDSTRFIALIPNSIAAELAPKDYGAWQIRPGDHEVLLVSDTLYRVCKLPCAKLDSIVLKPGAHVVKSF